MDKRSIVTTDEAGYGVFFAEHDAKVLLSHVGYRDTMIIVQASDERIFIALAPVRLQEIDVFAGERFDRTAALGVNNVSIKFLKAVPTFVGEADIIKSLTFLPGVSEGREGYSHLFVRGGDQDQNLMLLDGATLFNINHFGGFVSMFNSDIIGSVDFYKNAWPSRFGGRLSSVLDVRSAEGNYHEHRRSYQLGVVAPKFSATGPVWKDRISYSVGARRTLLDLFTSGKAKSLRNGDETGDIGNLAVQDVNVRLDGRISDNQHLSLSVLHGRDWYAFLEHEPVSQEVTENRYTIKNDLVAINYRWNGSSGTSLSTHVSYSSYRHNYEDVFRNDPNPSAEFLGYQSLNSGNRMQSFKVNVHARSRLSDVLKINYGLENEVLNGLILLDRNERYGNALISDESKRVGANGTNIAAGFAEIEYRISERFDINGGMRLSAYSSAGFDALLLEPKVLARYRLNGNSTLNASFARQRQTVGLLSFTDDMGRFREYYTPAGLHIAPPISTQISAGYFRSLTGVFSNFSVELFHKSQSGISKFIPSVDYLENVVLYQDYLHSDGRLAASGAEILLQKGHGRLQGSMSYTYSRSRSQFSTINEGRAFDSDFDFQHSANILLLYAFGDGYRLSGHWTYKTGRPFTLPTSTVALGDGRFGFPVFSSINNSRMPAFHRLDINLERRWVGRKNNNKWFGIGVYNVYNRVNPFFAQPDYQSGKLEITGMFPIIPFFYIGFER